jgi:hypothetical protein
MNVLIKYPSRGRPDTFKNTIKLFINKLSNKHDVKFICSFDEDDSSMNNDNVRDYIKSLNFNIEYFYNNNKNKIEAINANMENQNFDVLILIADDIFPIINGYDDHICEIFKNSIYNLDCVIHTNTARWSNVLDVFCIMGKSYYDRFKYIYNPNYKSIFCDNEYTEVAKILNRSVFVHETIMEHYCIVGDETSNNNLKYNQDDWSTYEERKKINFELK